MFRSNPGVKRPILYFAVAALAIAMAVPMALSSGQMQVGGIFDECYDAPCSGAAVYADARD